MEFKRLISFAIVAMAILMGWNYFFPAPEPVPVTQQATTDAAGQPSTAPNGTAAQETKLGKGERIQVTTDMFKATIDTKGGDLRRLELLQHNATGDETQQMVLLGDDPNYTYVAQSDLLGVDGQYLLKDVAFSAAQNNYTLNGDTLEVTLSAPETNGVVVNKVYTFKKGSYEIGVRFEVANQGAAPVKLDAVYRLLRDGSTPEGESRLAHVYTGPALYTPEGGFQKVSFGDLDSDYSKGRDAADYERRAPSGWVSMIQHYFVSAWILEPKDQASVCAQGGADCQFDIRKRSDGLYSSGVRVPMAAVAPGQTGQLNMTLYSGPEEYSIMQGVADNLILSKDYGKVHIFASPLFWLLNEIHKFVGNWGWSIVLLTVVVKLVLYPLTSASYRSMAKMRAVAPKMTAMREQYGDDKVKLQQEMMSLYKKEKINPLGGCLPMLVQIPVFIGLYWALFASVELRQAPWMGWITDLARPDPYYVLPALMAITMFVQTFLNPPPADPMQAKMMKIMPIAFSVMFFFFPAGLVLYWLVNNILSIAQQWLVNRKIAKQTELARVEAKRQ
ncbi:MAG: membrane protein insertase YidC [Neisseriaceae bacterium]|nr:membrane protein insertase YidC [Neisseriaceae bacterium]MBP6862311.1 membrane protein insertase YidC [Neisseriaceae bacterium]